MQPPRETTAWTVGMVGCLVLCGCGGLPIDWDHWHLPEVEDPAQMLRGRVAGWEARLFAEHLSPEGLLLYRIPEASHPATGNRLDLADQACWSGYLLAALSCRQACEPTPENLARVRQVVAGLRRLHDATDRSGLIARCLVPERIAPRVAHRLEDWRPARDPKGYAWRSSPSKDQYSGYVFGLVAAAVLVPDSTVRETCADLLTRIALHLHQGGLRIRDRDGAVTRYGDLRGRIFGFPIGVNAALSLAILHSAARLGKDPGVVAAARARTRALVDALQPLHFEILGIRNYNNDLMAAVAIATIGLCGGEPRLRQELRRALGPFLRHFRGEGNAFFYSVGALFGIRDPDAERCVLRNLATAPADLRGRHLSAAIFDDLPRRFGRDRKGRPRSRHALPLAHRPTSSFIWRSNPYKLPRAEELSAPARVSGVDLVCAYWFGRYCGWIPAPAP